jgi:hypothetical protein
MTTKQKRELKKPTKFNLKRAEATVDKIIRENKEWIKEMARK